jgi:4-cresol dehydrogenase (hydroxylating)
MPSAVERAMDAAAKVVGPDHVKRSHADLVAAAKATIPAPQSPLGVIYPGSADEVVAIVNIAREHALAIWPCSKGKNWGYGSATPATENAVVLHLERLDRIIEVNEELAYAVVEPGVTYRQLKRHLEMHHPSLWCDCTDGPPDGSVIGNALDRGLGVTHYSDHFGSLCGLEVVLPDAQVIRTGGGPKDCKTWHTHKWGVGPYLEGMFSQSNYGVVVKAGVWLMPRPEAFCSFQFDLRDEADLPALVDVVRQLMLAGTLQAASHIVNDIVALAILAQYSAPLLDKYSRLPDDTLKIMRERYLVHAWSFGGGIQGTTALVKAVKQELRKRLAPLGTIMFIDDRIVGLASAVNRVAHTRLGKAPVEWMVRRFAGKSLEMLAAAPHVHSVLQGTPSDFFVRHAYFKSRIPKPEVADPDRDNCGLIWFAPIAPMTGKHIQQILAMCRPLFERYEFDFYVALLTQNPRSMIVLMAIFFLKENAGQVDKAAQLYEALSRATSEAGYQPYRISVTGMSKLADMAPDFAALTRCIKEALDPDGVLAPGKYGI